MALTLVRPDARIDKPEVLPVNRRKGRCQPLLATSRLARRSLWRKWGRALGPEFFAREARVVSFFDPVALGNYRP
jgi:hypothetical protein